MPINENEIIWDESLPAEQISQPQTAEVMQPQAVGLNETSIAWDDAPQMEAPQTQMQATQPQQEEMSMFDRVMKYKQELGKTLTENTPVMQIPQMVTKFAGEAMKKEGSQVAEAQSIKSRLENIDFAYSDLADTLKAGVGDQEARGILNAKRNRLNDEVVGILKDRGIEAYNDNGKLLVVTKNKDGEEELINLDENILDDIIGGFTSGAGEIASGIAGASGGAIQAQRMLPPTASPQQRALVGTIGAGLGGYTGATVGRATDLIRNAISLNKEIDAEDVVEKSLDAGTADLIGATALTALGKGASKLVEPLKKASDRVKTLLKEGNIAGATRQVKEDYGLTDTDINNAFESVKKDVEGLDDLRGDDLQRVKLLSAVQQQAQGKAPIIEAIRKNAKAAIETSKEIDSRAKQVKQAADRFAKKPSAIRKSIQAYEKAVGKNYGEVKKLIGDALPNYKSDLDITSFKPTLDDINSRVIDPTVKEKLTNLADSLASQKTETVDDLINTRQLFNKFYGKNKSHFESKPDKEALLNIQRTIDDKIDEALNTLPDNASKPLKAAFKDAKKKYSDMFKTQDTATYNAIFKKGASEDEIGKSLVKYSKSADADLETVLSKLSPVQRTKSEFSILKQMIDSAQTKEEAKAIDFSKLLDDIGTSREIFKTPQAKQLLSNIEKFNEKFAKDVDIQSVAQGVTPRVKKNIATNVEGKARMEIASKYFEAIQRLFPTEIGRRLSLQKSIESALENSRTAKEFFFKASKIKGMPNKDREQLKKTVQDLNRISTKLQKESEK